MSVSDPVLAIDTCGAQCAVAVLSAGAVHRRVERVARGQAELLFPLIDEALAAAGLVHADLARIVCCTGPGSFVGTRIAVAAARGLALGVGCPATGITRFEALAAEARDGAGQRVGVALAGRGGAIHFQAFDQTGAPVAPPGIVSDQPDLFDGLDVVAGDGAPGHQPPPRRLIEGLPDPAVLARLGAARPPEGSPAPLYLRPPEAALPREAPPRILD